jgi:hypothetical protein
VEVKNHAWCTLCRWGFRKDLWICSKGSNRSSKSYFGSGKKNDPETGRSQEPAKVGGLHHTTMHRVLVSKDVCLFFKLNTTLLSKAQSVPNNARYGSEFSMISMTSNLAFVFTPSMLTFTFSSWPMG